MGLATRVDREREDGQGLANLTTKHTVKIFQVSLAKTR